MYDIQEKETQLTVPYTATSSGQILNLADGNSGMTAIYRSMAGLQLSSSGLDTTNCYTPAIKMMSTDTSFTTENPKLLALITGRATENYSSDTDGGMNVDFFTSPDNAGATNIPVAVMSVGEKTGMGTQSPAHTLDISGTFGFRPSSDLSLLAASTITISSAYMRVVGNGAARTLTSTPTITPIGDGTVLWIQGTHDTNTITLQDESSLAGTCLSLAGGTNCTLGKGDMIWLMYDSGESMWYELFRSNN